MDIKKIKHCEPFVYIYIKIYNVYIVMLTYMVFHKAMLLALYCSLFIFFLLNTFFTHFPIFTNLQIYTSFPSSSDSDQMAMFIVLLISLNGSPITLSP